MDMQLFAFVGPLMISLFLLLQRRPLLFVLLVCVPLLLGSLSASIYYAFQVCLLWKSFVASSCSSFVFLGVQIGYMDGDYTSWVYCKPWTRAAPFVAGVACGALLARADAREHPLAKWRWSTLLLCHVLAAGALVYCAIAHWMLIVNNAAVSFPQLEAWSVSYSSLYGPVWSALLVWLSCSVYFRLFPRLLLAVLESRIFAVLGRLGFGIYLVINEETRLVFVSPTTKQVHPMLLHAREYNRVQLPQLTMIWLVDNWIAVFFGSAFFAAVLFVVVEHPLGVLAKRLLPQPKKN